MKRIRFFCDLPLVIASVFLLIVFSVLCVWMIAIAPNYAVPSDIFSIQCIWATLLMLFYIGMVIASKRILTFVIFDSDGITIWTPFMSSQTCEYKRYSHIYPASYFHGNLIGFGVRVHYVVFSQKYLSDKVLMNINHLANSSEVFKIRMRHKKFEELLTLLPPYQASMLQSAVKKQNSKA